MIIIEKLLFFILTILYSLFIGRQLLIPIKGSIIEK
jgi:hypothetical protein